MKKTTIVALTLALIVSCIFTVTPAKAEETAIEEAASEVIEAAMQIVPEETRTLAKVAFWLGSESGCSAAAGEVAMTFERAVRHIELPEEERGFVKSVFRLGAVVAETELERAEEGAMNVPKSTNDEEFAPTEDLDATDGNEEDGESRKGVRVIILTDDTDEPPIKMVE